MKTIVCLFALLALGSALPLSSENDEELLVPLAASEPKITPEQKECIEQSLLQIVNDNPQLNWWFTAVENANQRLIAKAQKCLRLENPDNQRKCFRVVGIIARAERLRLILILPKNERPIIGVINRAVRSCLNDQQDNFINDYFVDDIPQDY